MGVWSEFVLLMRSRAAMLRNGVRFAPTAHRRIGILLGIGSVLLFVVILVAFGALLHATRGQSELLLRRLIERTALYLFLFLLAGGIPFVSGVLLVPGDLPLLAGGPVRPGTIVAARLVDAVIAASGQFVVIGVPLLVASVWAVGADLVGWLLFTLLLALFLTLPALLIAALLLLMARTLGVRRVKAAVAVTSAVLSVVMCLLAVSEFSGQSARYGGFGWDTGAIADAERTPPPPPTLPSTWASDAILALGTGPANALLPLCLLLLATFAAAALCVLIGGPVLVGESLLEGDATGIRRSSGRPLLDVLTGFLPFPTPVQALIAKDLRYIARDLVLLSQIGIPVILYLVPFVIGARMGGGPSSDLLYLTLGIVGMIVYMETSILGLSSVGLEGRGFWLLLTAPITAGAMIRAKWLGATVVSLAMSLPLYLFACLYYRAAPLFFTLGTALLVLATVSLCGLGVGISGLFPRFVYENPAHRASLSALIWGFAGASGYVLLSGILLGGGLYAAWQWPEKGAFFLTVGISLFVLMSFAACALPLAAARARLDSYVWEE